MISERPLCSWNLRWYGAIVLATAICIIATVAIGQVNKYPATITPAVVPPYSVYLNDYSTPGSNALTAAIVFNDFNEPSWNFRLRIKIESSQVRLETRPEFRPLTPLNLTPGVIRTFSGSDWEEYLNYNNLSIAGSSFTALVNSGGRLPEGNYSFCFQVLDYETGDPLSEEICRLVWLKLQDAPRVNLPSCNSSLKIDLTQHAFSWQLFDAPPPNNTSGTQHQLTIWELTEAPANIQQAVANGQALQVFQSALLEQPNYLYGPADPPLEVGKQYVYRVQTIDAGGKEKFKNQGYSEFCSFYFGWPVNGKIILKTPERGGGFRKKDIPTVSWKASDRQLAGQPISYEIKIAALVGPQTAEQALNSNEPWYYYNTPPSSANYERSQQVDKTLEVATQYAWQVKAFTDQLEVGRSEVSYFNGPALMENFFAGIHRVAVDYLNGTDLNDISGGGRIRLESNANAWTPVKFDHLQLRDGGGFYYMTAGEFFVDAVKTVSLRAKLEENGSATFHTSRFRINSEGIFAWGHITWAFPHATLATGVATVKTRSEWTNFNTFSVTTAAGIAEDNRFRLLDPYNFSVNLTPSGTIYVDENVFYLNLQGEVELPPNIKSGLPGVATVPFRKAEQLFYLEQDSVVAAAILPVSRTAISITPTRYIIDFAEQKSPGRHEGDPAWKGIYIVGFEITMGASLDGNGQFSLSKDHRQLVAQTDGENSLAFVTSEGLRLKAGVAFPDSTVLTFQTFPAFASTLQVDVVDSEVMGDQSRLTGSLMIPIVSTQKRYTITAPLSTQGFRDGYLDDLAGEQFTFNPGSGDQEISLVVKRAVMAGYERIDMTLDLEWSALQVRLNSLSDFRVWGDYSIGFGSRNGTIPLSERNQGSLSGYPVTVAVMGAGSNAGNYVFATTADAVLGDDVSGADGNPSINIYSVAPNPHVPVDAGGAIVANVSQSIPFEQAASSVTQSFEQVQQALVAKLNVTQEEIIQEAEALKNSLASADRNIHSAEEIVGGETTPAEAAEVEFVPDNRFSNRQQQVIYDIAAGFIEEMSRPVLLPLKRTTDSLSLTISASVFSLVDKSSVLVRQQVATIVNKVAEKLKASLQNDKVPLDGYIQELADRITYVVVQEIDQALRQSVKNNIADPVNLLLKEQIYGRVRKHIVENGTNAFYATLTGDTDAGSEALKKMVDETPDLIEAMVKDAVALVNLENLRSTVEGTASDFVSNISVSRLAHDLRVQAERVMNQAIAQESGRAIAALSEKYAPELGLGNMNVPNANPINFVGIAQRLAQGDLKGAFAIDPVPVKLFTPVVDLVGFIKYTPDHPVYGDVWLGDIDVLFKAPKRFQFNAIYFNGRKEDVPYWFCQITPPGGSNQPYELGRPLAKKAKPLAEPVDIGAAQIVAASGRMYHHMKETPGSGIVPDAAMRYGAYMHFVFFDKPSGGQNLRLEVAGEINTSENGDYTIAFDGNVQVQSKAPSPLEADTQAAVQGTISIRYNSAEEHFLGYAAIVLKRPELCAQASLLVDVKPGAWRVAIGSREQRVIFVPGCAGWSPTGWLDLNQNEAELGLGLQLSATAGTPNIDIGLATFNFQVDAGIAAGIMAAIQYRPDFELLRAGVWVDIWATVLANYKMPASNWKSITLVEIFIRGDMTMYFKPPPTVLEGKLHGTVSILFFNINFEANMRKQLG